MRLNPTVGDAALINPPTPRTACDNSCQYADNGERPKNWPKPGVKLTLKRFCIFLSPAVERAPVSLFAKVFATTAGLAGATLAALSAPIAPTAAREGASMAPNSGWV